MADDGYQVNVEPQSNAGKWILIVLAILVVAGFGYAHYTTHKSVEALTQDLAASQARQEYTIWQQYSTSVGTWDARGLGLGGSRLGLIVLGDLPFNAWNLR